MEVRLTLIPGAAGTRKLLRQYGEKLVCVRYRYDRARKRRYKTVELVVDEQPWHPGRRPTDRVAVRIQPWETEVRARLKRAGALWRPRQQLWEIPYRAALDLGFEDRIVGPSAPPPPISPPLDRPSR